MKLYTAEELYPFFRRCGALSTDTRMIPPGSIYLALRGERFDGNAFAGEALAGGAAFCIVDRPEAVIDERCLLVEDALLTLQALGSIHRRTLGLPILAIAGSNGKTTTKELIARVLSRNYRLFSTPGNLNNHIGLPLCLLRLTPEDELAVLELGANHPGEHEMLCRIAEPDAVLLTNIGKDHLEGFGGMDGVERSNVEVFDYLREKGGLAFVNADEERICRNLAGLSEIMAYSTGTPAADLPIAVWGRIQERFPTLAVEVSSSETGESTVIGTHLFGSFNAYNVLAAAAVGERYGVPMADIKEAIESYVPQNNRSQFLTWGSNRCILDAYNANPSSMQGAVADFSDFPAPRKVLILGDMFELGEESQKEHQAIVEAIRPEDFMEVFFVGDEFMQVRDERKGKFFPTLPDLMAYLAAHPLQEATIYLKGSRGMRLERVLSESFV